MDVTSMDGQHKARDKSSSGLGSSDATIRACDTTTSGPVNHTPHKDRCQEKDEDSDLTQSVRSLNKTGLRFGCANTHSEGGDEEGFPSDRRLSQTPSCPPGEQDEELERRVSQCSGRQRQPVAQHPQLAPEIQYTRGSHRHWRPPHVQEQNGRQYHDQQTPVTSRLENPNLPQTMHHVTHYPRWTERSNCLSGHNIARIINSHGNTTSSGDHSSGTDNSSFSYSDISDCSSPFQDFYPDNHDKDGSLKVPAAFGSRSKVPEDVRLRINSRERQRMHDLNSALDSLRQVRVKEGNTLCVVC